MFDYQSAPTDCAGPQLVDQSSIHEALENNAERIHARWARHLAAISHELRTPLTGIAGFASLLESDDLTRPQHQLVSQIGECTQAMVHMVNDLLDEAMAQSGDLQIASRPFSPAKLARDCTAVIAAARQNSTVVVSCHIDRSVPNTAHGDAHRIRQIVMNLMANAANACEQGKVELVLRQRGNGSAIGAGPRLIWTVLDNGTGISASDIARLFAPFERGQAEKPHGDQGAGLGLTISQNLAQKMGGKITVRSTPKRGSMFTFHQPLAMTPPGQVPLDSLNSLQLPRILLIQSGKSDRVTTEAIVQGFGFRLDCADDPANFVTMLRSAERSGYRYIAVLVDIDDTPAAALHIIRTIRTAGLTAELLPAYALSLSNTDAKRRQCSDAGLQGVLSKPLSHNSFAGLARTLVVTAPLQIPDIPQQTGLGRG